MGVAFFTLFVVENTLFRDAALFTLFVVVFTLSEICSSFYLACVWKFLPCLLHIKMCQMYGKIGRNGFFRSFFESKPVLVEKWEINPH